jgi:RNA polymerase sigma-70 factor (ECF subfamily)
MATGSQEPSEEYISSSGESACGESAYKKTAASDPVRLDSATIAALYREHSAELRRFLVGVLRDETLAADTLQVAFVRAMEVGHTTGEESRKAWLFRVAYNEALAVRRREAVGKRILDNLTRPSNLGGTPESELVTREDIERVRVAIGNLPLEQREVVRKRIYEQKTFAEAAKELGVPLGTALTRMRTALAKLRDVLRDR